MSHYEKRELLRLARNGDARRVRSLLDDGVEFEFLHGKTGKTPLMTAAFAGHVEVVRLLLSKGASPNLTADDGASALFWAARNGHIDVARELISAGAELDARREKTGPAPIHVAISCGHDEVALLLLREGARKDSRYMQMGLTEFAEWCGRPELARQLGR